ncbi:MAG TPA: YcgN family cysteine cluster protein [Gammaproteobacteria bacterium]|nr:YcgN family cysteine cluster protein [Gammaproteobacteria bacterium]
MAEHSDKPFWETKTLAEMNREEWESLCDHCGKCCLHKLEDDESGEVYYCNVVCHLFDMQRCTCGDYANRATRVPTCAVLTVENIPQFAWMPKTCAYRLLSEGRPLPGWHPLITGDPESVYRAGHSVRGRVVIEDEDTDLQLHITDWDL